MSTSKSSRRSFIKTLLSSVGALGSFELGAFGQAKQAEVFKGKSVFNRILSKSSHWRTLPIGVLMGKIARELEGTPYQSHTLELAVDREICSVNLEGLDCVTFFETTLGFARMLKKGGSTPEALLNEVAFTRYRGGVAGDFSSRLHYTSDWLFDNQVKHSIQLLADLPGSELFRPQVGFMSTHSGSYPQLVAHPEMIEKIRNQEEKINSRSFEFIPLNKLSEAEPMLRTGDIVGLCTNQPGLDISHTGLVYCGDDGIPHFMHASSLKGNYKVTLQAVPISKTWVSSKTITGAIFARPLEP
ncbi:MAG: DUF1460 domain-containing protein [Candidatus Obscuribacterales bacterium]|nr:DUF1460 domain-containing protein [Candidatus Obscuribacterales bacterium]